MPSRSNRSWLSSRSNSAREEIAMVRTATGSFADMAGLWRGDVAGGEMGRLLPQPWAATANSGLELFAVDAFLEVVLGVEKQAHGAFAGFADHHFHHVADFVRVGGGA